MSDSNQPQLDGLLARQRREIAQRIESEQATAAFFARQQREILARVALQVELDPFFARQRRDLAARLAPLPHHSARSRFALAAAAAVLVVLFGFGALRPPSPNDPFGDPEVIDATAWFETGFDAAPVDPLEAFGAWEEGTPARDVDEKPEHPLLPPDDRFDPLAQLDVRQPERAQLGRG
jgi:hypothetical protein